MIEQLTDRTLKVIRFKSKPSQQEIRDDILRIFKSSDLGFTDESLAGKVKTPDRRKIYTSVLQEIASVPRLMFQIRPVIMKVGVCDAAVSCT